MATCDIKKIDSNITGLRMALEECLGQLPPDGEVVWSVLEPNSYSDFGVTIEKVARAPITRDRQRKKPIVVGIDAAGGFNQDLTQVNAQELLSGFLFADIRTKPSYLLSGVAGALTVNEGIAGFPRLESTGAINFITAGIAPGEWIFIGGDLAATRFDEDSNNGFKRVRAVEANALVLDKSNFPMVDDDGAAKTISVYLGRVLKNEAGGSLIKRKTFQLERTLGSLDGLDPPQSEYLVGAVPSEMTLNLATRDKLTADFSFMAVDHEVRTQAEGLKPGARPALVEVDAFNSSNHIRRIRVATAGGFDAAPEPLFAFATDLSVSVNNTLAANYAIGTPTAFEISAGTFVVSGDIEAYFSDVRALQAVRRNEDMTIDIALVSSGAGIVVDMPLVSLGGGQLNVELDTPIMLPLTSDAVSGSKVDPALNHTILFTFFDTLPQSAE